MTKASGRTAIYLTADEKRIVRQVFEHVYEEMNSRITSNKYSRPYQIDRMTKRVCEDAMDRVYNKFEETLGDLAEQE